VIEISTRSPDRLFDAYTHSETIRRLLATQGIPLYPCFL